MRLPMIWFDFGGVLSPPLDDHFAGYHLKTGIPPESLKSAMAEVARELGMPTLAPIELGTLTEAEWGNRLAKALRAADPALNLSRARLETFGEQWFDGVTANPLMVATLRNLRENGFRVGILSNNVHEWEPYWTNIAPADEVDCLIDSCKVGCRKPDPEIFRLAAKAASVEPADCVLVDDLEENCAAARAEGWRTVHFRTDRQVLQELAHVTGLPSLL